MILLKIYLCRTNEKRAHMPYDIVEDIHMTYDIVQDVHMQG